MPRRIEANVPALDGIGPFTYQGLWAMRASHSTATLSPGGPRGLYGLRRDTDTRTYPDMSSTPNTSKSDANASKAPEKPKSDDTPHIGVLEEDDEFEEFGCADWEDTQTDLAHLNGAAPGAANSSGDKLWEDNWDDDDIEDEFSVQLRNELAKTGKGEAMQH
jgi:26 proteasome complex subunit DSS1